MNERGEVTLLSCFVLFILMSLVLLCGLELGKSFRLLEKRTKIFLCLKETKGTHLEFMHFMGRANWGIKNINRTSLIMMFIPGLQGAATEAQKLKKVLQYSQEAKLLWYLKNLKQINAKGCPIDPRMYLTPFEIGDRLLKRSPEGAAKLKEDQWDYYFFLRPYFLTLNVNSSQWEAIHPKLKTKAQEKLGKLPSHLSSHFSSVAH